jgi:outer membrane lipoprotein-sorting protein
MSAVMNRRFLLAAAALLLPGAAQAQPAPTLSVQDKADLARISAYLDGLRTLKAHFLQVSPDGDTSEGTAWLSRPGRMRFEYDPPAPFLLVAGFGSAVFFDKQLKQTSAVPLSTTPLGLLLADHINFGDEVRVTSVSRFPGQIQVTMVRATAPADGSLSLVFADAPLALRQWAVTDAQRQETRVSLFNIQLGGSFPAQMFQFEDPRLKRQGGDAPNGG